MNITPNLGLKKPDSTDPIDISVLNENADTLDAFAGETNTALAGKQDTIADLTAIRSGAAAGATAVQPAEFEADQQRQDAVIATKATIDSVWGLGTALSANTDLDNIIDVGRYYCSGSSVGNTLVNCPTIQPFVLTVSAFQTVGNRIQRIESLNLSTFAVEIYERMKISSGWKSWIKFEGTQAAAASQSAPAQ